MKKIAVFSGTSEGRQLSESLSLSGYVVDVFVATDYGEKVMNKNDFLHVNSGRLDEKDIATYLKETDPEIVFDATHPHAKIVTENIKNACEKTGNKYIRVSRKLYDLESFDWLKVSNIDSKWCEKNITVVKNIDEVKKILDKKFCEKTDVCKQNITNEVFKTNDVENTHVNIKNIMLTTGVKELSCFENVSYKDNLFVRVLPGSESIGITEKLGFKRRNVIAMEGPFSVMMNRALIEQYGISLFVTKNSGKRGGFPEKIKACYESNTEVIVVDFDNKNEDGISVEEAIKYVDSIAGNKMVNLFGESDELPGENKLSTSSTSKSESVKSLKIVGAGICKEEYLTVNALNAIKEAELIIGAARMVEFAKTLNKNAEFSAEYISEKVVNIIEKTSLKRIVYLVSGDSGFFSGAKGLADKLYSNIAVEIIPGISSVSYMASKLNISYSDMSIYSMHGRDFDIDTIKNCDDNGFFLLCTGFSDVERIRDSKLSTLFDLYIGKNFGMEDECICRMEQGNGSLYSIVPLSSFITDSMSDSKFSLFVIAGIKREGQKNNSVYAHPQKDETTSKFCGLSLMVAATGSGRGKTSFVSGLLALLKEENDNIHAFKCGPDYIDPMFHSSVLGIPSRNLDSFFCDDETLNNVFSENLGSINVIEAAMGLYDGIGATDMYSAYEIASKLKIPILLVVDGYGMGYSIIALIKGFLEKDSRKLIKGVVLNRVSDKFYSKIRPVIVSELKIKVYGHIKNNSELSLKSRHLGLMSPDENNFNAVLNTIKNEIATNVDYNDIINDYMDYNNESSLCDNETIDDIKNIKPIEDIEKDHLNRRVKIAVAKDEAFTFIYEDNIELLKKYGADIIYFSPINDDKMPECDGLILYGGYPENYAKELSDNKSMLESVRAFISSNKPVIAECGGFMYLLDGIYAGQDNETIYEMAGVIKGKAAKANGLVRFGYVNVNIKCHNKKYIIKGHEFHHFDIIDGSADLAEIYDNESFIEYISDNKTYNGIVVKDNLIAGYPHLYYLSCREFVTDFVNACAIIN